MAVAKAEKFANYWRLEYVVDMDLSKCFDTLNHELIINSVNKRISDGKVLKLYRSILAKWNTRRYKKIATKILEQELKLTVNVKKTHITNIDKGIAYLGFIIKRKYISIQPKRIEKLKDKIRKLTSRNFGLNLEYMV